MKTVDGLLNAKRPKPPAPKASPDGFEWPNQREAGVEVAEKLAASLQELLPAKGWKHVDLARALWGTAGATDQPRNTGTARRWVMGELPIPNEEAAGFIAQVLDVPMARLLKPNGKFNPKPDMIRERSPNGVNKWKAKAKKARAVYLKGPRKKKVKAEPPIKAKRKYTKSAKVNGHDAGAQGWVLADGVKPPEYQITSDEAPAGHVNFTLSAVLPHERAMAILHMLQHGESAG